MSGVSSMVVTRVRIIFGVTTFGCRFATATKCGNSLIHPSCRNRKPSPPRYAADDSDHTDADDPDPFHGNFRKTHFHCSASIHGKSSERRAAWAERGPGAA